jgi:hypothetical protein
MQFLEKFIGSIDAKFIMKALALLAVLTATLTTLSNELEKNGFTGDVKKDSK